MIKDIQNFFLIVFIVIAFISFLRYLPRIRAWFGALRKQTRVYSEKKNRIAIIVPARNESAVIDTLFESLNKQTYDRDYFDVHVIVKTHDDPTVKMARKEKAFIHVVSSQKCKGDALDGCLKSILKRTPDLYDGFLIIDADCLLDSKCLEEFNNAFASDRDVIQGKKIVKNYLSKNKASNSWASSCNGLIWTLIDDMGNRYKSDHGITNMTIGTGILIRSNVIKELNGWPYRQTLTEDIEFMNDCALRHISTFYYSYALVYVEEATSLRMTNKRRRRWLTGVVDSKRLYNERLNDELVTKEDKINHYYVTALSPAYTYIGNATLFSLANYIFAFVLWLLGDANCTRSFMYGTIGVLLIYGSFLLMTLIIIIVDHKNIHLNIIGKIILLFTHPIFYMGYIPIIAKALFGLSNKEWEVIERVEVYDKDEVRV